MGVNADAVQRLYVAYFNRPADPVGAAYWESQLDALTGGPTVLANQAQLTSIAAGFSGSAEYAALYAGLTNSQIINSLYQNLFGRDAEPAGLVYWAGALTDGTYTFAQIALQLTYSAQGTDATAIANKLAASNAFTLALDTTAEIVGYAGMDAAASARDWLATVNHDPATLAAATAAATLDAAVAAATAGGIVGESITLTTGVDTINIATANTIDTVKGFYDGTAADTFTVADSIAGNGKTVLELVIDTAGSAPYVEMSGVDKISAIAATAAAFTMDASTYGSDISSIALTGKDGFVLNVDNLTVNGSLDVSIVAAADSDVNVTGAMDGIAYSVQVSNDDADSVGSVVSAGTAGIDIALGQNDDAYVYLYQLSTKSAAAVSVGDLTVGGITLDVGTSASATITITNYAHNTGTGSATVGNLTFGDISIVEAANGSEISVFAYNSATANNGAATVGNLTVGNVDVVLGNGASGMTSFTFYNSAESTKGAATAGNVTFGNISVDAGTSVDYGLYGYVYNQADATTSGNAKVGNITVGNVDIAMGDNGGNATLYLSNSAQADKGTATAGNIAVDTVAMEIGNYVTSSGDMNFTAYNYADVNTSGAATVGTITIGDINMTAGTNNTVNLSVSNWANTAKGAAKAGAVTIGNVTGTVGLNGSFDGWVGVYADGTAGDTVGNVTIGNIDLYGEPDANLSFEVSVSANAGSVSDVMIGDIAMTVDNSGSASFEMDVYAKTNVGNVTIGDVNLTLGSSASIDTFSISVYASTGDIASFTIGDVTIVGGKGSYDDSQGFTIYAGDDIGNVSIGDVTVTAGQSADFDSMTWSFDAGAGNIGNISMGDTTLTAGVLADNWRYVDFSADNEIAGVKAGDVTLSAAKSGSAWLSHDYTASDDIGNVVYGNISAVANGAGADAGFSFEMDANGNTIGTVTFGNVDLNAAGDSAWAGASIWLDDTGDTVGLATVGDITLTASNTKAAITGADVGFTMDSNGSVTVGDIAVAAGAATASFATAATVDFYLNINTGNNLTVGNITVTGGSRNDGIDDIAGNADDALLDNLDVLTTWLGLTETGSGSITIGNVDYSGYETSATINVSGFKGAANITAAQGDTVITDNKSKNVITLDSGDDTVNMSAITSTTDKTSATAIDEIISFTSGKDLISIDTTAGVSDFAFVTSAAADYASFLTAANAAMTNDGTDIYARKVGADMYVAIESNADGLVDFVVKLSGVSTVTAADFAIV